QVRDVVRVRLVSSSGVGAAGFGPRISFDGETSTEGTFDQMAAFGSRWEDATAGGVSAAFVMYTRSGGGSFSEAVVVSSGGYMQQIGKTLATLAPAGDGSIAWATDAKNVSADGATPGSIAVGSGSGAFVFRVGGNWRVFY